MANLAQLQSVKLLYPESELHSLMQIEISVYPWLRIRIGFDNLDWYGIDFYVKPVGALLENAHHKWDVLVRCVFPIVKKSPTLGPILRGNGNMFIT